MKVIYFTKDDIMIIGLILFCMNYFERKYLPIFWTVFIYSCLNILFDTALIAASNSVYAKAVMSDIWGIIFAFILLGTFAITYANYKDYE